MCRYSPYRSLRSPQKNQAYPRVKRRASSFHSTWYRHFKHESKDELNNISRDEKSHDEKRNAERIVIVHFYSSWYLPTCWFYSTNKLASYKGNSKRVNDAIQLQWIVKAIKAGLIEKFKSSARQAATPHLRISRYPTFHRELLRKGFLLDSASNIHVCNNNGRFMELMTTLLQTMPPCLSLDIELQ
jgi:hypothetical protein